MLGVPSTIVILPTAATVVGQQATVHLQIQDRYSNLASTTSAYVLLRSTGSAAVLTTGGNISFSNGVATAILLDLAAESVTLSLSNPTISVQVSSSQLQTVSPGLESNSC